MASVFALKTGNTTTSVLTSAAQDTTACNFLSVVINVPVARTATLSDSASNTWTPHPNSPQVVNGALRAYGFYCVNPTTSATHTFTVTPSATDAVYFEVKGNSGRATVSAVEGTAYAADSGSTTSHVGPSTGALSQGGDDILVLIVDDNFEVTGSNMTWTPGTGLTMAAADYNGDGRNFGTGGVAYADNASAGGLSATWTTSGTTTGAAFILAVKQSGVIGSCTVAWIV